MQGEDNIAVHILLAADDRHKVVAFQDGNRRKNAFKGSIGDLLGLDEQGRIVGSFAIFQGGLIYSLDGAIRAAGGARAGQGG